MKKNSTILEFIGYFFASVSALIVDFSIFIFCLHILEWGWLISSSLGFSFGILIAYLMSVGFVFKVRKYVNTPHIESAIFLMTGLLGVLLTFLILWFCIEILFWSPETSKIASSGFTFISNFAVRKYLLFRKTLNV